MEEKKLTDEEIIKALECCAMISVNPHLRGECIDCPYFQKHIDCVESKRSEMDCIDLIHRLQSENKRLKKQVEQGLKDMKLEVGIRDKEIERLNLAVEGLTAENKVVHKENDELIEKVERLTEEKWNVQDDLDNYHIENVELITMNAELQKQVDELTERYLEACAKGSIDIELADFMNKVEKRLDRVQCQQLTNIICELDEYRKKIEQGKMVELPCKVGDTVYCVYGATGIDEWEVGGIQISESTALFLLGHKGTNDYNAAHLSEKGRYLFFTREEAEKRLKELQE